MDYKLLNVDYKHWLCFHKHFFKNFVRTIAFLFFHFDNKLEDRPKISRFIPTRAKELKLLITFRRGEITESSFSFV